MDSIWNSTVKEDFPRMERKRLVQKCTMREIHHAENDGAEAWLNRSHATTPVRVGAPVWYVYLPHWLVGQPKRAGS